MKSERPARPSIRGAIALTCAALMLAISPLAASAQCVGYIGFFTTPPSAAEYYSRLAVPGYTSSPYDTVVMTFRFHDGTVPPAESLTYWVNPSTYLSAADKTALTGLPSPTDAEVRAAMRALDAAAGVTRLVAAFGATDNPIASGSDPTVVAADLANFVTTYDLDGVIIDFEEVFFFDQGGTAENWLTTLTTTLRAQLPDAIIAHAPQAPYLRPFPNPFPAYPQGAYQTVHANVGDLIDYYTVQFYNQGATTYETEASLVQASNGWATGSALDEIIATGIPAEKLFVMKPATPGDAFNTGYIPPATLSTILAANPGSWGGAAAWQHNTDSDAGFPFGNAVCPTVQPVPDCSTLRWRFDESAGASAVAGTVVPEAACGVDGEIAGAGATFTGDAIDLPGGGSGSGAAYVDLPNGIVSSLTDATFEAWYTPLGVNNWMRVFDFGSSANGEVPPNAAGNGENYIFYSAARFADINLQRTETSTATGFYREDSDLPSSLSQGYHVAVTFEADGAGPGLHQITTYRDGMPIAQGVSAGALSSVDDVNNWLGRSNFGGDGFFDGTIEEFRLYDQALSWPEALYSFQQGPDVTDVVVPESGFGLALLTAAGALAGAARRPRRAPDDSRR